VYGPPSLAQKDMVRLLESLASRAASALENARLYGELAGRERQLTSRVGRLVEGQEEERRRVAHEVHGSLAQLAATAHRHLQAFAYHHPQSSPQTQEELEGILKLVKQTVGEARRIIADLRPAALDDFGLESAIGFRVEQLRSEGWLVSYEETLGEERLPAALETVLFRVALEALTNVGKHAQSSRVQLALLRQGAKVCLRVRDFGCGFELPTTPRGAGASAEGVGLASMQEQIALLGGELEVRSKPGVGTLVAAEVPLPLPAEATRQGGPLP
jgi:signal transduction histidine kinase